MKLWKKLGFPKPKSEASKGELSLVDNEIYSGIVVPEGYYYFVRLDGWCFHRVCKELKLEKPFDRFLATALCKCAEEFFNIFNCSLAYIFSDEINLLFLRKPGFERIEKIDSVFAGIASSRATIELRKLKKFDFVVGFDCRVIPADKKDVLRYLIWRQAECKRNCYNAFAQLALEKKGFCGEELSKRLAGKNISALKRLIKKEGLLSGMEPWHEKGILLYWKKYRKKGYDPIRKKEVIAERRKVFVDWNPVLFNSASGKSFILNLMKNGVV